MKRVLVVVALIICAAVLGLWRSQGGVRAGLSRVINAAGENNSAGVTADETRKTFDLKPGARVQVEGINGRVEIQTSDTKTAEVFVKRTGENPASLRRREIIIELTSDGLLVRSKQNHVGFWDHLFGSDPKEEVTIKAPRQIALSFKGINGKVFSGDIDGPLEVKGINGRAELGQVSDYLEVDGINGSIAVGLNKLSERGVRIHGVNGGIELKLSSSLNADLTAKGMNGSVRSEIAEVTVAKDDRWSHYSARIGSGGPTIEISGINGNVRLTKAEGASAASVPNEKSSNSNSPATSRNVR